MKNGYFEKSRTPYINICALLTALSVAFIFEVNAQSDFTTKKEK